MSRITACFQQLKQNGKKALIPYITAGDPAPSVTVSLLHALVAGGANVLELGIPFSDPMADGPVIQQAHERALLAKTTLATVLELVSEFRKQDKQTPIVLMGYLNPVEIFGYEKFAKLAQQAGVDGVLLVDMPPEEGHEITTLLLQNNIDPIFLITPTTKPERVSLITQQARGYLYYVSLKGVTGEADVPVEAVSHSLLQLRPMTNLPLCVGFGIRSSQSAAKLAQVADGVIIGSRLVREIDAHQKESAKLPEILKKLLLEFRGAID